MKPQILISAALIDDDAGHILLVRKAGTEFFMQGGGKPEAGEDPFAALRRELQEELNLKIDRRETPFLGRFIASAANEPGVDVVADLFHVRRKFQPLPSAEIVETVWVLS